MTDKTKSAFFIKNANDAGTEKRFTAGSVVPLDEGTFHNYETAGIVRAATAEEVRAAKGDDAKTDTKSEDNAAGAKKSAA